MNDQEYLTSIIAPLVNYPDEAKVERTVDELGVLLTLSLNPKDVPLIIGKRGQTANSIRQLLNVLGGKNKSRINFKINQPPFEDRYAHHREYKTHFTPGATS